MDGQVLNARHQFDNERWPLAQAAAWIIWRSRDRVVQLLSDIAAERDGCVHVFDILGEAMRQENDQGRSPEGVALPFVEAQADLWEQLKRGRLVALGVKVGETTWGPIPALAWSGLDYFYCDSGDRIRSDRTTLQFTMGLPSAVPQCLKSGRISGRTKPDQRGGGSRGSVKRSSMRSFPNCLRRTALC